jgi:hypothetical protein
MKELWEHIVKLKDKKYKSKVNEKDIAIWRTIKKYMNSKLRKKSGTLVEK